MGFVAFLVAPLVAILVHFLIGLVPPFVALLIVFGDLLMGFKPALMELEAALIRSLLRIFASLGFLTFFRTSC